jgi:hypothetical protein
VSRVLSGKAIIAAVLVAFLAAAVSAPPAGAAKPCPVEYCTDSSGRYVLEVPPLTYNPFLADYADCVWNVEVDFGDGTQGDYVFDAAVGLTGEHVFPMPGTSYTVQVWLREGAHSESEEPCPDYGQSATVRYRTEAEEADPPPVEGPPQPKPGEPPTPGPPPTAPNVQETPDSGASAPEPEPTAHWKRCRGGVYAHLVGCRKARRVAGAAGTKLTRPGTAQARGFACRLPRGPLQSIVCKRGEQSVLAPGPDRGRRLSA